jgi:hypothetical protein
MKFLIVAVTSGLTATTLAATPWAADCQDQYNATMSTVFKRQTSAARALLETGCAALPDWKVAQSEFVAAHQKLFDAGCLGKAWVDEAKAAADQAVTEFENAQTTNCGKQ